MGDCYPIRQGPWSYKSVLTFIALTSPLAWLYAIPVERFMSVDRAISANIWFLALVALWRVGLLLHFLKTYGRFSMGVVILVSLLPLALIMFALMALNLEHAVFEIMAGIGDERAPRDNLEQVHDGVYASTWFLGVLSFWALPFLLFFYLALIFETYRTQKREIPED